MKYPVVLLAGEDGWIVAKCPVLRGCVSQGKTEEEALKNIKEAIAQTLVTRRELGLPLRDEPGDLREVEVV